MVFPHAKAPRRAGFSASAALPIVMARGHFRSLIKLVKVSPLVLSISLQLQCLSSCAWRVVQRCQIFSLEAFLQLGSKNSGYVWPHLPQLLKDQWSHPRPCAEEGLGPGSLTTRVSFRTTSALFQLFQSVCVSFQKSRFSQEQCHLGLSWRPWCSRDPSQHRGFFRAGWCWWEAGSPFGWNLLLGNSTGAADCSRVSVAPSL